MKNFTNTDYALNKFSDGIVYKFGDKIVEVTLDDYLAENPGKTAADFAVLKKTSDEIYLEQARKENAQTKKNISLGALSERETLINSPEDRMIAGIDEDERKTEHRQQQEIAKLALDKLTETQRRRYLLHHVKGLSTREIADLEGVSQRSVMDSIEWAEKKIKKIQKT